MSGTPAWRDTARPIRCCGAPTTGGAKVAPPRARAQARKDARSCAGWSARTSQVKRVTPTVAKGAVFVPFNQPGFAANGLLDGDFVTTVTLEPAEELVEAGADLGAGA